MKRDAMWVGMDTMVASAVGFLLRLAIARLLAPEQFGIAAIVLTIMAIMQTLNDFGLTASLVQRSADKFDRMLVDTTFTISGIISIALFVSILVLGAPLAVSWFGEQDLYAYLAVISIAVLFSPFTTVSMALLYRQRQFKRLALARILSTFAGFVAASVVLIIAPSPWVVVLQTLASGVTYTLFVTLAARHRFRIQVAKGQIKSIFAFSGFILAAEMTGTLQTHAGVLILGAALGSTSAGFFSLALYLTDTVRGVVMSVLNRVTFVHYSIHQNDPLEVRRALLNTIKWNCRIIFPLMFAMIAFGPHIAVAFLGEGWNEMATTLRWLAATVIVGTAGGTTTTLFRGLGRPGMDFSIMVLTTLVLLLPSIYIFGSVFGITGAAVATFTIKTISVCIRLAITSRLIGNVFGAIFQKVVYFTAMQWPLLLCWTVIEIMAPDHAWWVDAAATIACLTIYAALEFPKAFPEWRIPQRPIKNVR